MSKQVPYSGIVSLAGKKRYSHIYKKIYIYMVEKSTQSEQKYLTHTQTATSDKQHKFVKQLI